MVILSSPDFQFLSGLVSKSLVRDEVIKACELGFSPANLSQSRSASFEIDSQLEGVTLRIEELKAAYNQLVKHKLSLQMEKARIHNCFVPFLKLPPELIGYIMELLCLSPSPARRFSPYGKKPPLELTCASICQKLREVAISTPSLWTRVSFTNRETRELYFRRSKTLPLHVLLLLHSDKSQQDWNAVMAHSSRLQRLILHLDTTYSDVVGDMLLSCNFPALESLALVFVSVGNGAVRDASYFLPQAPKLSHLWLSSLQGSVNLPIAPSTRALVFSPVTLQLSALDRYASQLINLTHLVLWGLSPSLTFENEDTIDFPRLSTLRMIYSDGLASFARCIRAKGLQTLILDSWWASPFQEWLKGPPNAECYFPQLHTLVLVASDIHAFNVKEVNHHFASIRHFAAFKTVGSPFVEYLQHAWFFRHLSRITLLPLPPTLTTGLSSVFPSSILSALKRVLEARIARGKRISIAAVHDKLRREGELCLQPYVDKVEYVTDWEGMMSLEGWVDVASHSYEMILGRDYPACELD